MRVGKPAEGCACGAAQLPSCLRSKPLLPRPRILPSVRPLCTFPTRGDAVLIAPIISRRRHHIAMDGNSRDLDAEDESAAEPLDSNLNAHPDGGAPPVAVQLPAESQFSSPPAAAQGAARSATAVFYRVPYGPFDRARQLCKMIKVRSEVMRKMSTLSVLRLTPVCH